MSSPIQDLTLPDHTAGRYIAEEAPDLSGIMSPFQTRVHRCLYLLMVTLIFEGVARKAAPSFLGILFFFFKDFVAVILLLLCIYGERNDETTRLFKLMGFFVLALAPCVLFTAFHDPLLAIFGLKQYALYPTVALAMCAAYLPNNQRAFFSMFRFIALSVIVTTLVAIAQNRLPAGNWLNLSVGGDDLSGFSAAGYLRVSSTFSFCGQYGYYLNALCFCLPLYFSFNQSPAGWRGKIQFLTLVGLFIAGTFLTGSRGSVLGNAAILGVGGLLAILFDRSGAVRKLLVPVCVGIGLLGLLQAIHPEFFAAYEARMATTEDHADIETRVESDLFGWMSGSVFAPPSAFGYGLGVMSNGADKLSGYAAQWRAGGVWTETDRATTFFEGGWYLMMVWYGFRLWVIIHSLILLLRMQSSELRLAGFFAWGFVFVIGVMGTLAMQPPLAIWWWLAVGLIICLEQFDRQPLVDETDL